MEISFGFSLDLHTVKYAPLAGSSNIPLPQFLAAKKAIINLKNCDDECFKWANTRALNPVENNSERSYRKLREKSNVLNCTGQRFLVNLIDIIGFEKHKSYIFVHVFGYEKRVYPRRISEHNYKRESTVNHLLISNDTKQHYCCCNKDINKLLSFQTSKHHNARFVCFRCLNTLNSKKSLASHHEYCKSYEAIQIELPAEGSKIFF